MKRLALALLLCSALPAHAATGYFIGQRFQSIGGTMYTVCQYNVLGTTVERLLPYPSMCPMNITI